MNKICLMINNLSELKCGADSFIIGLKDFNNINVLELDIDEIKNIKTNKEIIISMNKIIFNNELDKLENILKSLQGYKIIFDDLAILQIVKDNNLKIDLVWGNIHASTSYNSINTFYNFGVNYSIVSPDITLEEIVQIKHNTKSNLFVPLYGKFDLFSSKRFLITNYLKYINREKKDVEYKIKYNNQEYKIYEDNSGTHIIDSKFINGILDYKEILDNNFEYTLINSYDIDNINELVNSFITIRTLYENNLLDLKTLIEFHNKFTSLNTYPGFLHKKTIYKVGDDHE